MEKQKYYAVKTKCGHVGVNRYMPITFAVSANSKKEAAMYARGFKRVKHDHKDAILDVWEVTEEEFATIKEDNRNNPYLQATSRQEQNQICTNLEELLVTDHHRDKETYFSDDKDEVNRFKHKVQSLYIREARSEMRYELANY